ncbi:uncharacterized protein LOC112350286 [Selaginella moellendorffii]|uniref:Bowman-Birk inhibitor 5 n=1 Tax=Selaginella moellendorffii TaxID=88036 RepID=A0A1V0PLJ5_SELML|nr:uncharacterized protein LOC112350286 [Selaginella moellendorffii]ARE30275.1 Bowman-Birk inhibitor 5 [Selaginella moellendorffii]|eukprot:XP_024541989.1 uncharacterized protein LOC112350286 [Selaginella moellendorffii]
MAQSIKFAPLIALLLCIAVTAEVLDLPGDFFFVDGAASRPSECRPNSQCCPNSKFCPKGKYCTVCTRSNPPSCFCTKAPPNCGVGSSCCSDGDCPKGKECSVCTKSFPPICRCGPKPKLVLVSE